MSMAEREFIIEAIERVPHRYNFFRDEASWVSMLNWP